MASRAQRLIEAAKKPVPEGTYAVGLGLVVSGLAAYAFQILAFRALPKSEYTALNGLWDAGSGKSLLVQDAHKNTIYGLAFSADGTRVASASFDRSIKVWRIVA